MFRIVNYKATLVSLLLTIFTINTYSQDYYSHNTVVAGDSITYSIRVSVSPDSTKVVVLSNEDNTLLNTPRISISTGEVLRVGQFAAARLNVNIFRDILDDVFSDQELIDYYNSGNKIMIKFAINPVSGQTMEVEFYLDFNPGHPELMAIQVNKFEELETAFKQRLIWSLPSSSLDTNYVMMMESVFLYTLL